MKEEELRERVNDSLHDLGISVKRGHACSLSQTGEEYIEICITAKDIVRMIVAIISSFEGKTLYWRVPPEFDRDLCFDNTMKVYFRFLVSDAPVIYQTEEENTSVAHWVT